MAERDAWEWRRRKNLDPIVPVHKHHRGEVLRACSARVERTTACGPLGRHPTLLCTVLLTALSSCVAPKPPKQTPTEFQVIISTNAEAGKTCPVVINVTSVWAPDSADRFWRMSTADPPIFYDSAIFNVDAGHSVEFGISGDPTTNHDFKETLAAVDDDQRYKNKRGTVSFVAVGGKANSTRIAVNLADNNDYDAEHFIPFAKVVSGMATLDLVHAPSLGELSGDQVSTSYFQKGNTWIQQMDTRTTLISGVKVRWNGGELNAGISAPLCDSGGDYVQMVVGMVEAEVGHLEEISGLSGTASFMLMVAVTGGVVVGVCALIRCYTEWRKRRLLRYSRELEESGVEMVYDDEMGTAMDESHEDLGRGPSVEYDREHVRL